MQIALARSIAQGVPQLERQLLDALNNIQKGVNALTKAEQSHMRVTPPVLVVAEDSSTCHAVNISSATKTLRATPRLGQAEAIQFSLGCS